MIKHSFRPSEYLIKMMCGNIYKMPLQTHSQIMAVIRDQFIFSVACALDDLRRAASDGSLFWIISQTCTLRPEFLDRLKYHTQFTNKSQFDYDGFKIRFSEEIMNWSLVNPEQAIKQSLVWQDRCLCLVRGT